jgi:hypothetical protein
METQIEFHVRGGRSEMVEALSGYALHRLSFAIRRFKHRVRHLTVRLVDENGPRRGVDSRCSITADLARWWAPLPGGDSSLAIRCDHAGGWTTQ